MGSLNITGSGAVRPLLAIGTQSVITGPLHIDLGASVRIGARVYVGFDVKLLTYDHDIGSSEQRCWGLLAGPIDIEDGAWIGSCAVILPGVRIGKGAIVGAGSVVSRDVAPNTLVAGVPARVIRELDERSTPTVSRRRRLSQVGRG
jgi:maltose O-acetyltransferase